MAAKIMDGEELSKEILAQLKTRVERLGKKGIVPKLDIILAGDDDASQIYVRKKMQSSEEIGMKSELHLFPRNARQEEIIRMIEKLNSEKAVHGILVQIPLPSHMEEQKVLNSICPEKDVDGLTTYNLGNLFAGEAKFEPCTPKGIIKLLESENIRIEGGNAVVIGRSNIVGKPIALMLLKRNATVTICHSKTSDLKAHTGKADILVAAAGRPKLITGDMVKEGAVVIDAGISRSGGKVVGDVDFERVKEKASHITPVPGGVGPLTVAMVLENTIIAAERTTRKA
jgi:methylenetetrahydrofolate dehydrogenase (NADP+)/methenyltetrahydrofolate cyclohydrolase